MDPKDTVITAITRMTTTDEPIADLVGHGYREHLDTPGDPRTTTTRPSGLTPGTRYDIARVIADGDLVVTHALITVPGQPVLVGVDLWHVLDGELVERWASRTPEVQITASGRSQIDGAAEVDISADRAASLRVVTEWSRAVLLGGDLSAVPRFLSEQTYWQHNPAVADGIEGFIAAVGRLAEDGLSFDYERIDITIAEGDLVFTRGTGKLGAAVIFNDLWRVAGGRIVEHWDVVSPVGIRLPEAAGTPA